MIKATTVFRNSVIFLVLDVFCCVVEKVNEKEDKEKVEFNLRIKPSVCPHEMRLRAQPVKCVCI